MHTNWQMLFSGFWLSLHCPWDHEKPTREMLFVLGIQASPRMTETQYLIGRRAEGVLCLWSSWPHLLRPYLVIFIQFGSWIHSCPLLPDLPLSFFPSSLPSFHNEYLFTQPCSRLLEWSAGSNPCMHLFFFFNQIIWREKWAKKWNFGGVSLCVQTVWDLQPLARGTAIGLSNDEEWLWESELQDRVASW